MLEGEYRETKNITTINQEGKTVRPRRSKEALKPQLIACELV